MYHPHEHFESPADSQRIWRYMDFTKFVSMLSSKSLYFSSVDKLVDKFEGSYTKSDGSISPETIGEERAAFHGIISYMKRLTSRQWRKTMFVNCWHKNEHESAAMWQLYLTSNEGVAVVSTFERLKQAILPDTPEVFIGNVRYLNYDTDAIPLGNVLHPYLCKRLSYQHEQELRAVIWDVTLARPEMWDEAKMDWKPEVVFPPGINVPIDLDRLVEVVRVAPTSPKWFHDLVADTMKHYGLNKEVKQSNLAEDPVW